MEEIKTIAKKEAREGSGYKINWDNTDFEKKRINEVREYILSKDKKLVETRVTINYY